jgi:NADH:ubiquinone oxidoreductase subunit E
MNTEAGEIRVQFCLGSACFSRGNGSLLNSLQQEIASRGLKNRVQLTGMLCENRCGEGPTVIVDGKRYRGLDVQGVLDVIEELLRERKRV